jgi:hypothetical protein
METISKTFLGRYGGDETEEKCEDPLHAFVMGFARPNVIKEPDPPYIFNPKSKFKLTWDTVSACLILFYMLVVPIRLSFGQTVPSNDFAVGNGFWLWFDVFADLFFLLDIGFTFRTAIPHASGEEGFETRPAVLAKAYLKRWFWADIVSSIPLSMVSALADSNLSSEYLINKLVSSPVAQHFISLTSHLSAKVDSCV